MKKEMLIISGIVALAIVISFLSYFPLSFIGHMTQFDTGYKGDCKEYGRTGFYNIKYEKGGVVYDGKEYEDYCIDDKLGKKYTCSRYGFMVKKNIACDYNEMCFDGRCISLKESTFLIIPFTDNYYNKISEEIKQWLENNTKRNYFVLVEENIPFKQNIIFLGSPCDYKDKGNAVFKANIKWTCSEHKALLKDNPDVGIYWQKDYGNRVWKWVFNTSIERIYNSAFKDEKINFITNKEIIYNLARGKSDCLSIDLNNDNLINESDKQVFDIRYDLFLTTSCTSQECVAIDYSSDNVINGYDQRIFEARYKIDKGNRCKI